MTTSLTSPELTIAEAPGGVGIPGPRGGAGGGTEIEIETKTETGTETGGAIVPEKEVIVNSGEIGARIDGAKPIYNRRVTSNDVTNFSSIDYTPEKKTVPAIEATSLAAVTTNPEDIAIALLQKQKETIRVVTLAVNEIIILSYEFANSTIDLRLNNLRHLNNLTAIAAGDEANIVPKNLWISGTIGTAKYNGESMLSGYIVNS